MTSRVAQVIVFVVSIAGLVVSVALGLGLPLEIFLAIPAAFAMLDLL